MTVVTTASPENFELVKSRGADVVFDYHDPQCSRLIREYTNERLQFILDCISTKASYDIIAKAIPEVADKGINMVTLLPADAWPRNDITPTVILAYTSLGKAFAKFGIDFPEIAAHYEFGVTFWELSQKLLADGKIKPHPVALRKGGLAAVPDGYVP